MQAITKLPHNSSVVEGIKNLRARYSPQQSRWTYTRFTPTNQDGGGILIDGSGGSLANDREQVKTGEQNARKS